MGQREDVMASLARGDSRDGVARRKVAEEVGEVVTAGANEIAVFCDGEGPLVQPEDVATAARAVVLASDLRAPANGHVPEGEPSLHKLGVARQGWRNRLANIERLLTEALERTASTRVDEALTEVRAMLDDPGGTA